MQTSRHPLPLHPLATCLVLAFGAPHAGAIPAQATSIVVQNCLDHGAGSLRQAVIDSTTSAPIDLTQLTCSSITLTTGSIQVQRAQLIQGPGSAALTISGANLDRVFTETANQMLALSGMTIQNGYVDSFGGGCIYSAGALQLQDTVVRNCRALGSTTIKGGGVQVRGPFAAIRSSIVDNQVYSALGTAFGGGAYVYGSVALDHSTISGNVVSGAGLDTSTGGIYVLGTLLMAYSTVANSHVSGTPGAPGTIGGVKARAGATIVYSTISGNSVDGDIGGMFLTGTSASPIQIIESTISDNTADYYEGGLSTFGPTSILNSTIVFNRQGATNTSAGLYIFGATDIQSTIIAANTSAGTSTQNIGHGPTSSLTGANNLIGPSPGVTLPPDTIGGDPKLLPLHDNGGPTKTHALRPGSPAVNAGNNASTFATDQRGAGFPRIVGAHPDIGAFEGVDADSIFYSGFD